METPSGEEQVINDIRCQNGVEADLLRRAGQDKALSATIDNLKGGYARALVILSDELYAKPAHCVLEIIQNAADNAYAEKVIPTLEMELRRSDLQIWCNEVGFNEANVRAFCSIGNSTKKNTKGYIGEKGIGAKSMFKVATKITVLSRGYSFVLDRDKELGMISPIWVNKVAPAARRDWTGMNLNFGPNKPFDDLKAQLLQIKDTILLFIDNLSVFNIDIDGSLFSVERNMVGDCISLRTTEDNCSTTRKFFRFAKTVNMQVSDPKREGQRDTEVVLAFPLQDNGQPDLLMEPYVHAFLPLRRVGFKFVVQADFLTAANREDVLADNDWNTTIRDSLPSVFVDAIQALRAVSSLQFSWLHFLPRASDVADEFFQVVATEILERMETLAIIKCTDGIYRMPGEVRLVGNFGAADGHPFVGQEHLNFHYVSQEYPSDVLEILKEQLGVRAMSSYEFMSGLVSMSDRRQFKHKDDDWLEGVCELIEKYGFYGNRLSDHRVRWLPLIRLQNDSWVSCKSCYMYFFDSPSKISFPSGLPFWVIDRPSAISNRGSVLRKLGVRDLNTAKVVEQIVDLHRQRKPDFQDTIEQIMYLYRQRSQLDENIRHINLYDQHGRPHTGDNLYMDEPGDVSPDRLSALFGDSALFVNTSFQQPYSVSKLVEWQEWLVETFGVRTTPRVVDGQPAAEFVAAIDRYRLDDPPRLFRILKKYWSGISAQVLGHQKASFQAYFGELEVRCKGGQVVPLSATIFPSDEITHYRGESLDLLDIDDSSGDWSFLGTLGVSMELDAGFFLKRLIALSQTPGDKIPPSDVSDLYDQLKARSFNSEAAIRKAFGSHRLILFKDSWYGLESVVWKGPPYLTLMHALEDEYPHLKVFFQDLLRIEDAPPDSIAKELLEFSAATKEVKHDSPELDRLVLLLSHASNSMKDIREKDLAEWTSMVRSCAIFPVNSPLSTPDDTMKLMCATEAFFIPDTGKRMYNLFRDAVHFLALNSRQLCDASGLLKHLGVLPGRLIDSCVSRIVEVDKQSTKIASAQNDTFNYGASQYLNLRLPYLQRFLYFKRAKKSLEFSEFRVYQATHIKETCTLSFPESFVEIRESEIWVEPQERTLLVFSVNAFLTTPAGKLDVAKRLADLLDIDFQFTMNILSFDDTVLEKMMEMDGIGLLDDHPTGSTTAPWDLDEVPFWAYDIGFLGEKHVFDHLRSMLPDFGVDNWTSELRERAGLPPFTGISKADFLYRDSTGELTRQLLPNEPEIHGATPKIYIEVKSTCYGQDAVLHMKRQQFRRAAKLWRGHNPGAKPTKLYVLYRLSNIGKAGKPVMNIYVDAHEVLVRGRMRIASDSVEVRISGGDI